MPVNQYITVTNGQKRLSTAAASSTGVADAGRIICLDANGKLSNSILPAGIGEATEIIVASEALAAGNLINIYDNAGTRNVRKADASNNRPAHGFVLAAVTNGSNATVYRTGANSTYTGLTPGAIQYLSAASAGAATSTAPTASGHIVQEIGYAISATAIQFEFDGPIFIE